MTAEKWVYGGEALSRVDGRVVLTPYMLPGETARVEPQQERPDLIRTRLVEILTKSPDRTDPQCQYFHNCGGCQYQHATYESQLTRKVEILLEQLKRMGKLEYSGDVQTIAGEPYGYRNRTQFHVDGSRIGFYRAGTRELLNIESCPIASPRTNEVLTVLHQMAADKRWPQFLKSIEVVTNETDVLLNVEAAHPVARKFFEWCGERIPGAQRGYLDYPAGGDSFRVSHNAFFQVNRFLVDKLVELALEGAAGETALDLYAGVGLFSIPLARRFQKMIAVESGKAAARDLEENAKRANVAMDGEAQNVETFLPSLHAAPDFVLADPPRSGLGKVVTRELLRLKPRRITIVSCDPSTLARDLAALTGEGGYRLERLQLVDLFPQTYHIESVTHLVL